MKELSLSNSQHDLENFKNPFTREKCDKVTLCIYSKEGSIFGNKTATIEATIRFYSGPSSGYHVIYGNDLTQTIAEVNKFLTSL